RGRIATPGGAGHKASPVRKVEGRPAARVPALKATTERPANPDRARPKATVGSDCHALTGGTATST
ncbi:hypothetical protein, partial [Salmonella enterica]|uniref:hypothetical protein n=1 Tax=Salmonella enterica TaxID=28901 RepID=UPI003D2E1BCF